MKVEMYAIPSHQFSRSIVDKLSPFLYEESLVQTYDLSYLEKAVIVKSLIKKIFFAQMCAFYFSKTRWNCFWNKGWTVLYLGVIILPLKQKFKDLVVQFLGLSLNVLLTKLQPSESTHQKVIWILYASWRLFKIRTTFWWVDAK